MYILKGQALGAFKNFRDYGTSNHTCFHLFKTYSPLFFDTGVSLKLFLHLSAIFRMILLPSEDGKERKEKERFS